VGQQCQGNVQLYAGRHDLLDNRIVTTAWVKTFWHVSSGDQPWTTGENEPWAAFAKDNDTVLRHQFFEDGRNLSGPVSAPLVSCSLEPVYFSLNGPYCDQDDLGRIGHQ
jgi:hypothetical protein